VAVIAVGLTNPYNLFVRQSKIYIDLVSSNFERYTVVFVPFEIFNGV